MAVKEKNCNYLRYTRSSEMARYASYTNTGNQALPFSEEHCRYGSSRLGMDQRRDTLFLAGAYNPTWYGTSSARRELGNKHYELSNHLGNVLLSVTDKKAYKTLSGSLYFEAEITTISDYYPFGSAMQTRAYRAVGYRFGFNTQERETELGADLTSAEFWMYDGKLGRRWNVDPKAKPDESLYGVLGNNPICFVDCQGDSFIVNNPLGRNELNTGKFLDYLEGQFDCLVVFSLSSTNKLKYEFNQDRLNQLAALTGKSSEDYKKEFLVSNKFADLHKMISDPTRDARLVIYDQESTIPIGDFGGNQKIDIYDIKQLDKIVAYKKLGGYSALIHEMSEAYHYQVVQGKPSYTPETESAKIIYNEAHKHALTVQARVMGIKAIDTGMWLPDEKNHFRTTVTITGKNNKLIQLDLYRLNGDITDPL